MSKERDSDPKPRVILELDELIEQATTERSHYYVRSVAEKAQLAIGILMSENVKLEAALAVAVSAFEKIRDNCEDDSYRKTEARAVNALAEIERIKNEKETK